jgi:diguanylate cyclase (GGDEF)-like protein
MCGIIHGMSAEALSALLVGAPESLPQALRDAGWRVTEGHTLAGAGRHDAVLLCVTNAAELGERPGLTDAAFESAVVVLAQAGSEAAELALLRRGVEAVMAPASPAETARALRHAVERKRLERAARTAYATDLATGLPHLAQLVEHMTQLLALREREPAPMVLLVLRVQGFEQAAERLGVESGNVLRRKVAVRLRGGLRASDVVAAIGPDSFGVLLGRLEAKGDGERVAAKLVKALQQPILVAGQPCAVSAAVGLAIYPEHGKDVDSLLKRASAQAGSVATLGAQGFASSVVRSGGAAANDDDA